MAEKLIDRIDVLYDLVNNIAPRYFDMDSVDQNRTSYFGYLSEAAAKAIEDTITLEQRRSVDYCPELSNSGIRVRQTAKIRGVTVSRARPGRVFAAIGILKSDILDKGELYGKNELRFIIDRRSTITHNNISFSLPDDIIIRAIQKGNNYIYSASYSGEHNIYDTYLQVFEQTDGEDGSEYLMMTVFLYQFNYNIQEQVVTDLVSFTYDGLSFDYDSMLADFEVYYRRTATSDYIKLDIDHYLTTETTRAIYYNDDDDGILYIMNNPVLNIPTNSMIRVDMKETLGVDGNITLDTSPTYFSLYRDDGYNYAGVAVDCTLLSDTILADNGDDLSDIKRNLIDAKTRRDNITTEHDIISYIDDVDTNIQIIKKRNDIEDRRVYMYTLLRNASEIVPTSTRNLYLKGIVSPIDYGDFDQYDMTYDRKVLSAYSKFRMVIPEEWPDENEYMVKVPHDENEEGVYYFTCPFMILVNKYNIANYYLTTIDQTILLAKQNLPANVLYPFEMITHSVNIQRDAHCPPDEDGNARDNIYTMTTTMVRNTSNDDDLIIDDPDVDEYGQLIDPECIVAYAVYRCKNTPVAYVPMKISNYDDSSREFTFTGEFATNDFITEEELLVCTKGMYKTGTTTRFNSTIDYQNGYFDIFIMYKTDDTSGYSREHIAYSLLPDSLIDGYVLCNAYYNNKSNVYNLILDYSKFTSSWNEIKQRTQTTVSHTLHEVPFIEYDYGIEHMVELYPQFEHMYDLYGNLIKLTTDFDVSLKFITTWGQSKYVFVSGGRDAYGNEEIINLHDLNPVMRFRVYGVGIDVDEVTEFIRVYLRDHYITENRIFVSNICTLVEDTFPRVKSIKYMGVNELDGSYQEFFYDPPEFISQDVITRYVPEQLNIPIIEMELDED